ncbi:MAG: asparagine synthase-related protein [Acidobacteriota bacterium]
MDSGILAHLARGSGGALRTITFTAEPHDPWSDGAARAAPVARELGSLHEVVSIGPRDFLDALPDYLGSMSEPSLSAYLYYLVARKLPGTGRWLSGLGADEIFLGDPWYGKLLAAERAARFIGRVPVAARRLLAACAAPLAGTHRKKLALLAEERPGFSFLYAYARDNLDLGERLALLAPGIRPPGITRDHVNFSYGPPRGSGLAAMQETLLCRELPDGHGRDVSLFAENLDLSFPFLSPRVVATALVVRPEARAGVGKPFLRRACAAIAPAPVLSLPKGSFLVPPVAWLRGGLASYVRDRLSASRLAARGIWNVAEVTRRVEAFTAGRGSPFDVIRVLLLEAWMDRHGLEAA